MNNVSVCLSVTQNVSSLKLLYGVRFNLVLMVYTKICKKIFILVHTGKYENMCMTIDKRRLTD
jgi:uncharacterized ion transporter superfamily protein YfcC